MQRKHLFSILLFMSSITSYASVSPLAISIFPFFQFPPDNWTVAGVRTSLFFGEHDNLYGVDLGIIGNITQKDFFGMGMAFGFNKTKDANIVAAQLAGVTNINSGTVNVVGLQLAGIANVNSGNTNIIGFQAAMGANYNSKGRVLGLQLGGANLGPGTSIYGIQIGGFNRADSVFGLQLGVVNMAKALHGLQIGLLNFNSSGPLPFFPVLNFGI